MAALAGGQRLLRDAEDGEARGHHEALLRTRHADVDAPFIHAEVDGGERRHGIDEEQCGMVGGIHRLAHAGNIARHTGGGLVMRHQHGLVAVGGVGLELLGEDLDGHALAPGHVHHVDLEAHARAHVGPEQRELAEAGDQHLVARGQRVEHRGFPAAGAGGREQEDLAGAGLEDLLHVLEQRQGEGGQVRGALVFHGNVHGQAHGLRYIGRPRNEKSTKSRHLLSPIFHCVRSFMDGWGELENTPRTSLSASIRVGNHLSFRTVNCDCHRTPYPLG